MTAKGNCCRAFIIFAREPQSGRPDAGAVVLARRLGAPSWEDLILHRGGTGSGQPG